MNARTRIERPAETRGIAGACGSGRSVSGEQFSSSPSFIWKNSAAGSDEIEGDSSKERQFEDLLGRGLGKPEHQAGDDHQSADPRHYAGNEGEAGHNR